MHLECQTERPMRSTRVLEDRPQKTAAESGSPDLRLNTVDIGKRYELSVNSTGEIRRNPWCRRRAPRCELKGAAAPDTI